LISVAGATYGTARHFRVTVKLRGKRSDAAIGSYLKYILLVVLRIFHR